MVSILLLLVAFIIIIFLAKGIIIIKQAETMVIERLGKYERILESGINLIIPIIDNPRAIDWRYIKTDISGVNYVASQKTNKIDLREIVYDFPRQNVITKDNVAIAINALLYFQIVDPTSAVYEIANLPDAIEKLTQTTLRNLLGELDLDETLASRDTINNKLKIILDDATEKWGVKVNRVELQDIIPPKDIQDAMEKQMRAERDRRAAILQAEGAKKSAILEAEGVKESEINKAEGDKMSAILRAQGEAESRIKMAEAEAESIRKLTESIAHSGANPTSYLIAIKYIETLKEMVSGKDNKIVYLPIEATGVLSSIGGIKDMITGLNNNNNNY